MLKIEDLNDHHQTAYFDCGIPKLNIYLTKHAYQHQNKGISKTFVMTDEPENLSVLGYVTVNLCELDTTHLPKSQSMYPKLVPAVRISHLAVTVEYQKQGLGELLLVFAMEKTAIVSEQIGVIGMIVNTDYHYATEYCKQFGFIGLPTQPHTLFLPIETVMQAFVPH